MLEVTQQAVEAALRAGADYADARLVHESAESLTVRNQQMEGIDRADSRGIGIRVLVNGYWGFAATARVEPAEIDRTALLAVEIARAASRLPMEPVDLAPVEPVTGTWRSPMQTDPFEVPLQDKVALLVEATRRMQAGDGLAEIPNLGPQRVGELIMAARNMVWKGSFDTNGTAHALQVVSNLAYVAEGTRRHLING